GFSRDWSSDVCSSDLGAIAVYASTHVGRKYGRPIGASACPFAIIAGTAILATHASDPDHGTGTAIAAGAAFRIQGSHRNDVGLQDRKSVVEGTERVHG